MREKERSKPGVAPTRGASERAPVRCDGIFRRASDDGSAGDRASVQRVPWRSLELALRPRGVVAGDARACLLAHGDAGLRIWPFLLSKTRLAPLTGVLGALTPFRTDGCFAGLPRRTLSRTTPHLLGCCTRRWSAPARADPSRTELGAAALEHKLGVAQHVCAASGCPEACCAPRWTEPVRPPTARLHSRRVLPLSAAGDSSLNV